MRLPGEAPSRTRLALAVLVAPLAVPAWLALLGAAGLAAMAWREHVLGLAPEPSVLMAALGAAVLSAPASYATMLLVVLPCWLAARRATAGGGLCYVVVALGYLVALPVAAWAMGIGGDAFRLATIAAREVWGLDFGALALADAGMAQIAPAWGAAMAVTSPGVLAAAWTFRRIAVGGDEG